MPWLHIDVACGQGLVDCTWSAIYHGEDVVASCHGIETVRGPSYLVSPSPELCIATGYDAVHREKKLVEFRTLALLLA